jgi:hypothetical protein
VRLVRPREHFPPRRNGHDALRSDHTALHFDLCAAHFDLRAVHFGLFEAHSGRCGAHARREDNHFGSRAAILYNPGTLLEVLAWFRRCW